MAFGSYGGNHGFSAWAEDTSMSIVICFCSKVGCLKQIVYHLDSTLIAAPSSVTLKTAMYSLLFHVRFRSSALSQSRHHIQILEDQMSDWLIIRARCGAIVFGKTFYNNKTSRDK